MAAKNNIRSIRFSDELAELIDRQVGDTFTQKFENLVTRCVWEMPQKEKQLASIQADIRREQERLYNLRQASGRNPWHCKRPGRRGGARRSGGWESGPEQRPAR